MSGLRKVKINFIFYSRVVEHDTKVDFKISALFNHKIDSTCKKYVLVLQVKVMETQERKSRERREWASRIKKGVGQQKKENGRGIDKKKR